MVNDTRCYGCKIYSKSTYNALFYLERDVWIIKQLNVTQTAR